MGTLKITNGSVSANSFIGNLQGVATYATYDSIHGGEIFSSRSTGDNADVNNFKDAGSYRMGYSMQNVPPWVDYGQLLVFRGSSWSNTLTQIAFPYDSQEMYFRNGTTTSFSSNSWSQVLTDKNFTSFCASASHSHNYLSLSGGTASGSIYATNTSASEIDMGVTNAGGHIYFYSQQSTCGIYSDKGGGICRVDSSGSKMLFGKLATTNKGSSLPSSGSEDGEVFFKIL